MIIKLRPVTREDWRFILEIRNQKDVRMACYDTSIIDYSTHEKYMKKLDLNFFHYLQMVGILKKPMREY